MKSQKPVHSLYAIEECYLKPILKLVLFQRVAGGDYVLPQSFTRLHNP